VACIVEEVCPPLPLRLSHPQGWRLALDVLLLDSLRDAAAPAALMLLLRGLAVRGAARAAHGRSRAAGGWLGGAVGAAAAAAAALAVARAPADRAAQAPAFAYPRGLTDTMAAVAAGAVGMSALMMLAVGVSMHAGRARLGVIVAAAGVAAAYAALGAACRLSAAGLLCTAFAELE
jgi:hypothetical protein